LPFIKDNVILNLIIIEKQYRKFGKGDVSFGFRKPLI